VPAFLAVVVAAPMASPLLFGAGVLAIGFGGGLFSHGTLTATMNLAPKDQVGLALGAWGAVQATAAGVAVAAGGIVRDLAGHWLTAPAAGYVLVYGIEVLLLLATLAAMLPLMRRPGGQLAPGV
jgi:BCD family chlorophyll transporter-like MFS transporter